MKRTDLRTKVARVLDDTDFNDLPYEERVKIGKYTSRMQILTLWQVLNKDTDLTNERWRHRIREWLHNCCDDHLREYPAERKEE